MKIERMHHCSLLVSDLERALSFYQGVLGLACNDGRPDLGYDGAWLDVADQQIHLLVLPDPCANAERPEHGGRDQHVAFHVSDFDGLVSVLKEAGISFSRSKSGRAALFCRDPDGNALEFIGTD